MSSKKNTTPISLQPLDELFGTTGDGANGICEVSVSSLHSFPNHPFKVKNDKKMEELVKSVTEYGVLVPGIVRMRSAGGYELVAGHRRRRACEIAGIQKMPVIIKDLTDDEATVIMVDSNIQREELLFSEKAFAYKMKYDALKRQGKRTDLTSCRVGKKSAAEEVSQNTEDSARQVLRYIHLTELITELLYLTDIKKLPFNTAVELSYLKKDEQQLLIQYMNTHNMVPSMKQAEQLKKISKQEALTYLTIDKICMREEQEKEVQVQIPETKLKKYFPVDYSKEQMEEVIFKLLETWAEGERRVENQIDSIHQKALIRYLMYVEKTNNLVMDNKRWQKKVERRNRKMTIEDVIKKTFLPLSFMVFWFWMIEIIMKVSGQTDWFWWIFLAGLPFGIHKMRLILIPKGMDTTAILGMAALSVIIGALIGSIMIPVYVIRAIYVLIRYIVQK